MTRITRRHFCSLSGTFGAAAFLKPSAGLFQAFSSVVLSIDAQTALVTIPEDFIGLSYESGQLADPGFFSAENMELVALFRTLSPSGVLRLGGNLSEFTRWSGSESTSSGSPRESVGPDTGVRELRSYTVTPRAVRNLNEFLEATNWRCIYGLNLAGGTVEQALAEGASVANSLGPRLHCVQFGNEPDLFKHRDDSGRPWSFEEYCAKWTSFRAAFRRKLPKVLVAGPDTSNVWEWFRQFADQKTRDVSFLTSHYYAGGPPSDPDMTPEFLLRPGKRFDDECVRPIEYARTVGLPFRVAECNSCYNGGKLGVSDTFASALWSADLCLQVASLGCMGVNFHSGSESYYTPIAGSIKKEFVARPGFYGLLLAQSFAGKTLQAARLDAGGRNVTAYAAGTRGVTDLIAVFNKQATDIEVQVIGAEGNGRASLHRLEAPSLASKNGVTFGGSTVAANGSIRLLAETSAPLLNGVFTIHMPAYSAAIIRLDK